MLGPEADPLLNGGVAIDYAFVDLGLAGIAWVRGVIGWDTPSKFRHLLRDRLAALPAELF